MKPDLFSCEWFISYSELEGETNEIGHHLNLYAQIIEQRQQDYL